jgi:hypothetical protein
MTTESWHKKTISQVIGSEDIYEQQIFGRTFHNEQARERIAPLWEGWAVIVLSPGRKWEIQSIGNKANEFSIYCESHFF